MASVASSASFARIGLRLSAKRDSPTWARLVLVVIALCAATLYLWSIQRSGYNPFYANAARSMTKSWKAFLFGSFDPANSITIDKIPGYLWPQALATRAFGFRAWSMALPEAVEAGITVAVTYRLVRRWAGTYAALLTAGFLTLTPSLIGAARANNEECAFVMCLVLAASAAQRATTSGSLRGMVASGVWIGLAFQCKMVEAWAAFPVVAAAYLLAAPPAPRRRLLHVLAAGAVTIAVSLVWVVMVTLVPAHDRPYIDGTTNNNAFSMVFGYNAVTRFHALGINPTSVGSVPARGGVRAAAGATPGGRPSATSAGGRRGQSGRVPAPGAGGQAARGTAGRRGMRGGPTVMFSGDVASQIGWFYPLAVISAAVILWLRRRRPRTDPLRAGVIMWSLWLLVFGIVYSEGQIHTYYVVTLAPALAALGGVGLVQLWRAFQAGGRRAWALPLTVATTVGWACLIAYDFPYGDWLVPLLAGVGLTALAILALVRPRGIGTRRVIVAGFAMVLVSVLLAPATWASSVFTSSGASHGLPLGNIGPAGRGSGRLGGAGGRNAFAGFTRHHGASKADASDTATELDAGVWPAAGGRNRMWRGGGSNLTAAQRALFSYTAAHRDGATYLFAVAGWSQASPYILTKGADVLPMGGFTGQAPFPTLRQFETYVNSGALRYVLLPDDTGRTVQLGWLGGGTQPLLSVTTWVKRRCAVVPSAAYGESRTTTSSTAHGPGTLYLCSPAHASGHS